MKWEDIEAFEKARDDLYETFYPREYECEFIQDKRICRLRELAHQYHESTESYDQSICGPTGIPKDTEQHRLITQNAHRTMVGLVEQARRDGIEVSRGEFMHHVRMVSDT